MRRYEKVCSIRLFKNDEGKAQYSNNKWKPYVDGANADVTFRGDQTYSVKGFTNDDGSIGVSISRVVEYEGTDNPADNISQGGFKSAAQAAQSRHHPEKEQLDDTDVPF
tara:strand:- start:177 stop:503 length:327 start_codon:yes stop_codon:yes gene_type:complete